MAPSGATGKVAMLAKSNLGAQTLLRVQADVFGFGGGLFSFGHGISPQYRLPEKGGKLCAWLIQGSCRSWETPADVVGQNFDEV